MIDDRTVTVFTAGGMLPFEADRYPLPAALFAERRLTPLVACRDCGYAVLRVYHLHPSATVGTVIAAVLRHEADHHRGEPSDRTSEQDGSEQARAGRHRGPNPDEQAAR